MLGPRNKVADDKASAASAPSGTTAPNRQGHFLALLVLVACCGVVLVASGVREALGIAMLSWGFMSGQWIVLLALGSRPPAGRVFMWFGVGLILDGALVLFAESTLEAAQVAGLMFTAAGLLGGVCWCGLITLFMRFLD